MCRMRSEVATDGEIGVDHIATSAADAPRVGAVAAQRPDAANVRPATRDSTDHADLVRQVFRRAGEPVNAASKRAPTSDAVVFTEVPRRATVPATPPVLEIVLRSGHVVRVPSGADTTTL